MSDKCQEEMTRGPSNIGRCSFSEGNPLCAGTSTSKLWAHMNTHVFNKRMKKHSISHLEPHHFHRLLLIKLVPIPMKTLTISGSFELVTSQSDL